MDRHRLFGLMLTDHFSGSPYQVELEKDLSIKKQLLDVVILRKGPGVFTGPLPDGLANLANHNLLTFKSHHEPLDDWALSELIGHYVNYRKQVSPSMQNLLKKEEFRLYAVCARYPSNLASQVAVEEVQPGVYRCSCVNNEVRILVLRNMPQTPHNAVWHLFSAVPEQVDYGARHYQLRSSEASSLLRDLFKDYHLEGLAMPYTMEDYRREKAKELLEEMPIEEILDRIPSTAIEEYLKRRKQSQSSAADGSPSESQQNPPTE